MLKHYSLLSRKHTVVFFICVCVRVGGGWGPPCGKTGKPTSAVGSQFSASGLVLVGLIICFMS